MARAGSGRAGGGASYTYHSGPTGTRGSSRNGGQGYTTGGRGYTTGGSGYTTGGSGYTTGGGGGGGGGFWGSAPSYDGGYPPRPSAPPEYGWSVPPAGGAGTTDGAEDAELAEAIRRSRQTYSEEAHRHRFTPSAPPPL